MTPPAIAATKAFVEVLDVEETLSGVSVAVTDPVGVRMIEAGLVREPDADDDELTSIFEN